MRDIHVFNTGRPYTAKGQRIAWTILKTGPETLIGIGNESDVVFYDVDRQVYGVLSVMHSLDTPTDRDILFHYDHGRYDFWEDGDILTSLRAAGEAL